MRWFRHFSDTRLNPKLRTIEKRLGEAGYARAMKLLEVVAQRGGSGKTFNPRLELKKAHTGLAWLADELGIAERELDKTLGVFAKVGFISPKSWRQRKVIYVPQMREYLDEWTRKGQPQRQLWSSSGFAHAAEEKLRSGSGVPPEQLATESESESESETESRGENHPHSTLLDKQLGDDDSFHKLVKQLVSEFPTIPTRQLAWALRLVMGRVTTPPTNPVAYYRKSLRGVFENLTAETQGWLKNEAYRRLGESGDGLRVPDLAESLKCLAAENCLECGPHGELAQEAIDSAWRRLEEERRTQSELRVGRSPERRDEPRR